MHERYHESLNHLAPADICFGKEKDVLRKREKIKERTLRQKRLQNIQVQLVYNLIKCLFANCHFFPNVSGI